MKKATCTWGDGPDVMLTLEDDWFVLYEGPKHQSPPRGDYLYGYVTKGSTDLTADEALELAAQLTSAANSAKELDHLYVPKYVGSPLSEKELKEVLEDYPPETLTCYRCSQRDKCKYVDDLYNINGDCLAMKQREYAQTKRK